MIKTNKETKSIIKIIAYCIFIILGWICYFKVSPLMALITWSIGLALSIIIILSSLTSEDYVEMLYNNNKCKCLPNNHILQNIILYIFIIVLGPAIIIESMIIDKVLKPNIDKENLKSIEDVIEISKKILDSHDIKVNKDGVTSSDGVSIIKTDVIYPDNHGYEIRSYNKQLVKNAKDVLKKYGLDEYFLFRYFDYVDFGDTPSDWFIL